MKQKLILIMLLCGFLVIGTSCKDDKTYAELLQDEQDSIDKYLKGYRVADIPANLDDLETTNGDRESADAPYYRLEDGVYMQIISKGNGTPIQKGDKVYFRFLRQNLNTLASTGSADAVGNFYYENIDDYYFNYNTVTTSSSTTYGLGIEYPLQYVGNKAVVKVIVPSKMGFTESISSVIPYLYLIEYSLSEQ